MFIEVVTADTGNPPQLIAVDAIAWVSPIASGTQTYITLKFNQQTTADEPYTSFVARLTSVLKA